MLTFFSVAVVDRPVSATAEILVSRLAAWTLRGAATLQSRFGTVDALNPGARKPLLANAPWRIVQP